MASWPTALYGVVLFMSAIAYFILTRTLIGNHDENSTLAKALGSDFKGKVSVVVYLVGVGLAFVVPWASAVLYTLVAAWWLVPDQRIEHLMKE
jgi:uncharacterized membrane protein